MLAIAAAGLGVLVPASAEPTVQQRYYATAAVKFVGTHHHTWLLDVVATGSAAGAPAAPGVLDLSLRSCRGERCTASTSYRQVLRPAEFTADTKASRARLRTQAFGKLVDISWHTDSDYVVSPTLILYNHFLTDGGRAAAVVPADRFATATGVVLDRTCHPIESHLGSTVFLGNPPTESTRTSRRPSGAFKALKYARCR
jgi:hypothetical protein